MFRPALERFQWTVGWQNRRDQPGRSPISPCQPCRHSNLPKPAGLNSWQARSRTRKESPGLHASRIQIHDADPFPGFGMKSRISRLRWLSKEGQGCPSRKLNPRRLRSCGRRTGPNRPSQGSEELLGGGVPLWSTRTGLAETILPRTDALEVPGLKAMPWGFFQLPSDGTFPRESVQQLRGDTTLSCGK